MTEFIIHSISAVLHLAALAIIWVSGMVFEEKGPDAIESAGGPVIAVALAMIAFVLGLVA